MAYYGRGDYYSGLRGDYYRGDPFLGALLGAAGGLIGKGVSWLAGKIAAPTVGGAIARGVTSGAAAAAVPMTFGLAEGQGIRIGKKVIHPTAILPGGKPFITTVHRRRRMNVLNPRALRRALRRAEGFEKFAKRTVNALHTGPRKFKSRHHKRS